MAPPRCLDSPIMTLPFRRSPRAGIRPSPIFLAVLAVTAAGGYLAWQATAATRTARLGVFLFILAGWVVTVCVHEFAHAYLAWRFGDREVEARGYLTLNPLKYSHPVLSILLPVLFIAIGGIGLPGGAVYLHPHRFRSNAQRALVSLSGPAVNVGVRGAAAGAGAAGRPPQRARHLLVRGGRSGAAAGDGLDPEPAARSGPGRLRRDRALPGSEVPRSPPSSSSRSACWRCSRCCRSSRSTRPSSGPSTGCSSCPGCPAAVGQIGLHLLQVLANQLSTAGIFPRSGRSFGVSAAAGAFAPRCERWRAAASVGQCRRQAVSSERSAKLRRCGVRHRQTAFSGGNRCRHSLGSRYGGAGSSWPGGSCSSSRSRRCWPASAARTTATTSSCRTPRPRRWPDCCPRPAWTARTGPAAPWCCTPARAPSPTTPSRCSRRCARCATAASGSPRPPRPTA